MSVDDPEKLKTIDPPKTALNYSAAGRPETGKGVAVLDETDDDDIVDVEGDGGKQAQGVGLLDGGKQGGSTEERGSTADGRTQSGAVGVVKDSRGQDSTTPSTGDRDGGITSDTSADTSKRVTELQTKLAAAMKQIADLRAEQAARFDRFEQLLARSTDQKEFGNPSGIDTHAASPSGAPEAVRNAIPTTGDDPASPGPHNLPEAAADPDGRGPHVPDSATSPPVVANDLDGLASNEAHSTASHDAGNPGGIGRASQDPEPSQNRRGIEASEPAAPEVDKGEATELEEREAAQLEERENPHQEATRKQSEPSRLFSRENTEKAGAALTFLSIGAPNRVLGTVLQAVGSGLMFWSLLRDPEEHDDPEEHEREREEHKKRQA